MSKRELKQTSIEISCTASQKETIMARAKQANAKSTSEYILTLTLNGNTDEYGFVRRKAEGALLNAAAYQKLGEIIDVLKAKPSTEREDIENLINLMHEIRLDIAIRRLNAEAEKIVNEN